MNFDISAGLAKLTGARIAVVGNGYLGSRLFGFLQASKQEGGQVQLIARASIDAIRNGTWDYVFNCAGNTGDFREKIWDTVDSNLGLTSFLLGNAAIKEAYVNLSSTRVYGFSEDEQVCFREEDVNANCGSHLELDFVYDGTKKLVESILWNVGKKAEFRIITCRLSNVYGNYRRADLNDSTYVKVMIRHALEKKPLQLNQNATSTKGYVHIDDALLGIVQSALFSKKTGIYNICSGLSYSISDWLGYLGVEYSNKSENPAVFSRISIQKATTELGFQPRRFLHNLEFNEIFEDGSN